MEAAWHHICSAGVGVVSRIRFLSPVKIPYAKIGETIMWGEKKTPKKIKKKRKQLKTFVHGFKRALFMPDSSTLNWS